MDLPAPVRSRASQSPSPSQSHSASASATSSIRKRKLASDSESQSQDVGVDEEEEEEEEEEDYDGASMRDFTASRLGNAKIKTENSIKIEPSEVGKDSDSAAPAAVNLGPGVASVKEDIMVKNIFTENIQTSGAYSAREESLKREEEAGRLKFVCVSNDGIDEHMGMIPQQTRRYRGTPLFQWYSVSSHFVHLLPKVRSVSNPSVSVVFWEQPLCAFIAKGLKNIFGRQLPNMPKEYIVRLVMARNHKSVMVIRRNHVVGGITYRPYISQKFGEIAFCAITADEQVKGYGTRLMNHLKQHARDVDGLTHFLTYADNNAVGYFAKQGFTKEIHLEKEMWQGYIKDYDGGILMECKIDLKLPYTDLSTMIRRQRQAIDEKIRELSNCHIVYTGIDFQKKEAGIPKKIINVEDLPGLNEAGWTPDQWGHSRFKSVNASGDSASNQKSWTAFMRSLLKAMNDHPDAWPFKEPVDAREVPDYYDIIKDPMDLKTMLKRVESEQYYVTFEMFVADVKRMFANARSYNSPETIYYKCASRLEAHFSGKVQSGLQSGIKIQH